MGKGSFGCVFSPALTCEKEINKRAISKVFYDPEKALEEVEATKRIQDVIDPDNEFTVKTIEDCPIEKGVFDLKACGSTWTKTPSIFEIVYEFGGHDLASAPATNLSNFFADTEPIFKGLVSMYASDISHNDIKTDNVLYDPKSHRMVLIDFGESTNAPEALSNGTSLFNKGAESPFSAPDFTLYQNLTYYAERNRLNESSIRETTRVILSVRESFIYDLERMKLYDEQIKSEFMLYYNTNISFFSDTRLLLAQLNNYTKYSLKEHKKYGSFPAQYGKTDVYSWGITLFIVLLMLHKQGKIDQNASRAVPLIVNLIMNMVSWDSSNRYSSEEALDECLRIKKYMGKIAKSSARLGTTKTLGKPSVKRATSYVALSTPKKRYVQKTK